MLCRQIVFQHCFLIKKDTAPCLSSLKALTDRRAVLNVAYLFSYSVCSVLQNFGYLYTKLKAAVKSKAQ